MLSTSDLEIVLLRHPIVYTQQRAQVLSLDLVFFSGGQTGKTWTWSYVLSKYLKT